MSRKVFAPLALTLLLNACAGVMQPDEDQLADQIRAYYAGAAVEEAGDCPSPEIADITKRKVLEVAGARTVMQIRYTYYDPSIEGSSDWTRVLTTDRPCTGTSERAFTLERGLAGPSVVAMSGPSRDVTTE